MKYLCCLWVLLSTSLWGFFFASVCPDSEVTEGPESGTRAFAEGVEGERQEAAAGVWPAGGAGERKGSTDGGGEEPTAAAGTKPTLTLPPGGGGGSWMVTIKKTLSNILTTWLVCRGADFRWRVAVQTAGEGVPGLQGTAEHQAGVQTAVRGQPADPGEGEPRMLSGTAEYYKYFPDYKSHFCFILCLDLRPIY